MAMHNPPHPGEGLKEIIEAIPMTVTEFALHIGISRNNLSRILHGHAGITPEVSIRLAQAFGQQDLDLWFKMQATYDFWQAAQKPRRPVHPLAA